MKHKIYEMVQKRAIQQLLDIGFYSVNYNRAFGNSNFTCSLQAETEHFDILQDFPDAEMRECDQYRYYSINYKNIKITLTEDI